jgi:hypothetical protein
VDQVAQQRGGESSFYQFRGDNSGISGAKVVITDRKMRRPAPELIFPSVSDLAFIS